MNNQAAQTMPEFKPCPKCGCAEELSLDSSREAEASWIDCRWCGYKYQRRLDEESLVEKWNALSRKRMPSFDMETELAKLDKDRSPACDDCKRLREKLDFWYRRATAFAALSQTARVADGKDRKDAERYRWLRDTQTSYGISAQYDDAGSPLIWLRFSGYGSNGEGTDAAIDRAMLAAAPAASGGEDDPLCVQRKADCDFPRCQCKDDAPNPAAASVSERARALLSAQYRAAGFNAAADWIAEADMDAEENDLDRCVIRAIEQALTQPSADAVRELVERWRSNGHPYVSDCADELESLLSGGSHA